MAKHLLRQWLLRQQKPRNRFICFYQRTEVFDLGSFFFKAPPPGTRMNSISLKMLKAWAHMSPKFLPFADAA